MPNHAATVERVLAECRHLATFTEEPGRTTRRFLTPPVAEVHTHLRQRMTALGMAVHTDAIGNLRGLWTPPNSTNIPANPKLIFGSHIDTVPNAGAFDGVLGVVLALEWLRIAQQSNHPRPIEIIAFSEEEGVRYKTPFLGSRALAGTFDPALLDLTDADGIPMREAIRNFGLNPDEIPQATLTASDLAEYLEIHIEQGPILDSEDLPLAVVHTISGQTRMKFRFHGQSNHAGTTPMHLRRDALAAAAEWMTQIESDTCTRPAQDGQVATVGSLTVHPGAANVIPSTVELTLDLRSPTHIRGDIDLTAIHAAQAITQRRHLTFDYELTHDQSRVHMDKTLTATLANAIEAAGYPPRQLASGAGHDAMILGEKIPSAMLFLRSPGGLSHHPDETVLPQDIIAALQVAEHFFHRPSS